MVVEVEVRTRKGEERFLAGKARGSAFVINCFRESCQLFWGFFGCGNEEREGKCSLRWGREESANARYASAPKLCKKLWIRDASSSRRITAGERGVALSLGKWFRPYPCRL